MGINIKMNKNNLLQLTMGNNVSCLAIIGLAKNAGKTVTLNTLIKEAEKEGVRIAIASYGRDGEDIDAITLKEKPSIFIPPYTYFVTTEKLFEKSLLMGSIVVDTEIDTLLGKVKIYKSGAIGNSTELAGVNRGSRMMKIKKLLPEDTDLFLIDGALDRRSSAIPSLSHGMVLATGAVVGNTVDLIVQRTVDEVERMTLTSSIDKGINLMVSEILEKGRSGLIRENKITVFNNSVLGSVSESDYKYVKQNDILVLNGALIDTLVESLILEFDVEGCTLIVRDGTRVFLNTRNMNLLKKKNITLRVHEPVKLIAVTVNPYSPYGICVDSNLLVNTLKHSLQDAGINIPVFNVLSKGYLETETIL
jgi:hypothetical protein